MILQNALILFNLCIESKLPGKLQKCQTSNRSFFFPLAATSLENSLRQQPFVMSQIASTSHRHLSQEGGSSPS